jgi:hypothetical protein
MPKLPNLFVAGAPKAATTSLYYYLDQHPQIYMSAIKEPHYFATEVREQNCDRALRQRLAVEARDLHEFISGPMREKRFGGIVANWEDYLRLFSNATHETALGEASACYLWSPSAPARIAERIPDAKILVMLRDPADRAFSQYLHGLVTGAIHWSFREHIKRNLRDRSRQFSTHYPFLKFGLYYDQLRRYVERFGQNAWIGFYDEFKERPLAVFKSICRFLEVSAEFSRDMAYKHMQPQVPRTAAIGWLRRSGVWGGGRESHSIEVAPDHPPRTDSHARQSIWILRIDNT